LFSGPPVNGIVTIDVSQRACSVGYRAMVCRITDYHVVVMNPSTMPSAFSAANAELIPINASQGDPGHTTDHQTLVSGWRV